MNAHTQLIKHPALVGALAIKSNSKDETDYPSFWFSIENTNMRKLSILRLQCLSLKENILYQCCTHPKYFIGDPFQIAVVGVVDGGNPQGAEIVSIHDGSIHPTLKVIPLSWQCVQDAIEKCHFLSDKRQTLETPVGSDVVTLLKQLFSQVNDVYPSSNEVEKLHGFASRLSELIKSDSTESWQRQACVPFPTAVQTSTSLEQKIHRYRSYIQSNLSVALGISILVMDGIHRGMSLELCACGSLSLGKLICNDSLKKTIDEHASKLKEQPFPVSIFIPKSLDSDEIVELRKISNSKQKDNDLAQDITLMDDLASFVSVPSNNRTKRRSPDKQNATLNDLTKWCKTNLEQTNIFIGQNQPTLATKLIESNVGDDVEFPTVFKKSHSPTVQMFSKESGLLFDSDKSSRVSIKSSGKNKKCLTKIQAAVWLVLQLCSITSLKKEIMKFLRQSWPPSNRKVIRPNSPTSAKNAFVCFYQLYVEMFFRTHTYWSNKDVTIMPPDVLTLMTNVTHEVLKFFQHFQNMHPSLTDSEAKFDECTKLKLSNEQNKALALIKRHMGDTANHDDVFIQLNILNYIFTHQLKHPIGGLKGKSLARYEELPTSLVREIRLCVPGFAKHPFDPTDCTMQFDVLNSPSIAGCTSTEKADEAKFALLAQQMSGRRVHTQKKKVDEAQPTSTPVNGTQCASLNQSETVPKRPSNKNKSQSEKRSRKRKHDDPEQTDSSQGPSSSMQIDEDLSPQPQVETAEAASVQEASVQEASVQEASVQANSVIVNVREKEEVAEVKSLVSDNDEESADGTADDVDQKVEAATKKGDESNKNDDHVDTQDGNSSSSGESVEKYEGPDGLCHNVSMLLENRHIIQANWTTLEGHCDNLIDKTKIHKAELKKICNKMNQTLLPSSPAVDVPPSEVAPTPVTPDEYAIAAGKLKTTKQQLTHLRSLKRHIDASQKLLSDIKDNRLGYRCLFNRCESPCANFSLYCLHHLPESSHHHPKLFPTIRHSSNLMSATRDSTHVNAPCSFSPSHCCTGEQNNIPTLPCRKCSQAYYHSDCLKNYVGSTKSQNVTRSELDLCFSCISSDVSTSDETGGLPIYRCVNCSSAFPSSRVTHIDSLQVLNSIREDPTGLTDYGDNFLSFLVQEHGRCGEIEALYYICGYCHPLNSTAI